MNSGNGGQDDWNYWRRVANQQGANIDMNGKPSQPQNQQAKLEMTPAEKQQATATSLARKRLLETYSHQAGNYLVPEPTQTEAGQGQDVQPSLRPEGQTAQAQAGKPISAEEWKKYHSAWQNYYQQYYGGYYGKAAQDYVAREKLRFEREQAELGQQNAKQELDPAINIQDDFREQIRKTARKRAKKSNRRVRLWPLGVGLSIALLGVLLQYNQVIVGNVMAYMSPGNSSVNEITELDPTITLAVHESPTLMVPKLNIEVPVTFGSGNSVKEMAASMNNGIAHYAVAGASALPGEIGNFAVSGHSAGNVYERSNYKFIFSGLTRLESGDLAYMDYEGKRYTYKILGSKTVEPTDVQSLRQIASEHEGKPMLTMITCTPLGTSRYRLLVYGEQVYPEVTETTATPSEPTQQELEQEYEMPTNSDTPFEAFLKWITGRG